MKNLNSNPLHIAVRGNLIGKIWIPARYCKQYFGIEVDRERSRMSDNSLSITEAIEQHLSYNTGDFQSAAIAEAELIISYRNGNRTVSKQFDLREFPSAAEFFADKKAMREYEKIQDSEF